MSSWPAGTRNRLIVVLLVGAVVLLSGWFWLVSPLQARLRVQRGKAELARMQLQLAQTGQDRGPYYRELVKERLAEMEQLESLMADRADLLGWGYRTLVTHFRYYDIADRGWDPAIEGEVDVPPEVPYSMATLGVTGQGHFHSFGRFLAAFENYSPFLKIKHVSLQALTPGVGGVVRGMDDLERLSFRMEYQILVKTDETSVPSVDAR
jgi:hypothetical protein